jgi:DNA mismatch endonuclease (patch repair protein)
MASERLTPASDQTARSMRANRGRDTGPELAIRRYLHAWGLRYRVNWPIRLGGRPLRPDVVFGPSRVAVFVDGCFWHGCPEHATWPVSNAEFWRRKIETNRSRDVTQTDRLEQAGWTVLRFWEHEDPQEAAVRIASTVVGARS